MASLEQSSTEEVETTPEDGTNNNNTNTNNNNNDDNNTNNTTFSAAIENIDELEPIPSTPSPPAPTLAPITDDQDSENEKENTNESNNYNNNNNKTNNNNDSNNNSDEILTNIVTSPKVKQIVARVKRETMASQSISDYFKENLDNDLHVFIPALTKIFDNFGGITIDDIRARVVSYDVFDNTINNLKELIEIIESLKQLYSQFVKPKKIYNVPNDPSLAASPKIGQGNNSNNNNSNNSTPFDEKEEKLGQLDPRSEEFKKLKQGNQYISPGERLYILKPKGSIEHKQECSKIMLKYLKSMGLSGNTGKKLFDLMYEYNVYEPYHLQSKLTSDEFDDLYNNANSSLSGISLIGRQKYYLQGTRNGLTKKQIDKQLKTNTNEFGSNKDDNNNSDSSTPRLSNKGSSNKKKDKDGKSNLNNSNNSKSKTKGKSGKSKNKFGGRDRSKTTSGITSAYKNSGVLTNYGITSPRAARGINSITSPRASSKKSDTGSNTSTPRASNNNTTTNNNNNKSKKSSKNKKTQSAAAATTTVTIENLNDEIDKAIVNELNNLTINEELSLFLQNEGGLESVFCNVISNILVNKHGIDSMNTFMKKIRKDKTRNLYVTEAKSIHTTGGSQWSSFEKFLKKIK